MSRKPRADSYQKYVPLDLLDAAAASGVRRLSFVAARPSYASGLRHHALFSQSARKLPALPPEVWQVIAKATLAASDSSLSAWLQLSMVSRNWRQALKGAVLRVHVACMQSLQSFASVVTTRCLHNDCMHAAIVTTLEHGYRIMYLRMAVLRR